MFSKRSQDSVPDHSDIILAKTLLAWVNDRLFKLKLKEVSSIDVFRSGSEIIVLAEALSGGKVPTMGSGKRLPPEMLQMMAKTSGRRSTISHTPQEIPDDPNVDTIYLVLHFLKHHEHANIRTSNLADIHNGNHKAIVRLLWDLFVHYEFDQTYDQTIRKKSTKETIALWLSKALDREIKTRRIVTTLRDPMIYPQLAGKVIPSINDQTLSQLNVKDGIETIQTLMLQKASVPIVLEGTNLFDDKTPFKAVAVYVTMIAKSLGRMKETIDVQERFEQLTGQDAEVFLWTQHLRTLNSRLFDLQKRTDSYLNRLDQLSLVATDDRDLILDAVDSLLDSDLTEESDGQEVQRPLRRIEWDEATSVLGVVSKSPVIEDFVQVLWKRLNDVQDNYAEKLRDAEETIFEMESDHQDKTSELEKRIKELEAKNEELFGELNATKEQLKKNEALLEEQKQISNHHQRQKENLQKLLKNSAMPSNFPPIPPTSTRTAIAPKFASQRMSFVAPSGSGMPRSISNIALRPSSSKDNLSSEDFAASVPASFQSASPSSSSSQILEAALQAPSSSSAPSSAFSSSSSLPIPSITEPSEPSEPSTPEDPLYDSDEILADILTSVNDHIFESETTETQQKPKTRTLSKLPNLDLKEAMKLIPNDPNLLMSPTEAMKEEAKMNDSDLQRTSSSKDLSGSPAERPARPPNHNRSSSLFAKQPSIASMDTPHRASFSAAPPVLTTQVSFAFASLPPPILAMVSPRSESASSSASSSPVTEQRNCNEGSRSPRSPRAAPKESYKPAAASTADSPPIRRNAPIRRANSRSLNLQSSSELKTLIKQINDVQQ